MLMVLLAVVRVGLFPAQLPDGEAARLHARVAALPGMKAFDVLAHSACAPDEIECLAGVAQRSGLDVIVSVEPKTLHARAIAADGRLLGQSRAATLEQSVCEALGARPAVAAPSPSVEVATVRAEPRSTAGTVLLVSGAALLAGSVAAQLLTHSAPLPKMLAATGAGAVVASGLVFSLRGSF